MQRLVRILIATLACASGAGAAELRVGLGSTVTSLDPLFHIIGSNSAMARNLFDGLVNQDERQRLSPALALSWTAIDDTTWEFKLRPGVKFHDGSAFDAEDVAATLRRIPTIRNSPSSFLPYVQPIRTVTIIDPLTIRFVTEKPFPLLPSNLSRIAILPAEQETAQTEDFNAGKVIGTGPFRYADWKAGDRITLARNDGYWGEPAKWERVTFRMIANDAARVAALLAGDIDLAENLPPVDIAQVKGRGLTVVSTVSNRIMYLHLDQQRDQSPFVGTAAGTPLDRNPLRDVRVRQAMSLALDRELLVARIMDGLGVPAAQLVPEGYFGHVAGLAPHKADAAAARRLLGEAGFPSGFGLTLHGPNDRYPNDEKIVQAVAQMLTRAGIATKVSTLPAAVYFTRASRLEFSFILGGAAAETGEASSVLGPLLATFDSAKGAGTGNRGRYSSPRFDAALEKALATVDDGARERLLQEATRIAMDDVGVIPLFFLENVWGARPTLALRSRSDGYTLAADVTPR